MRLKLFGCILTLVTGYSVGYVEDNCTLIIQNTEFNGKIEMNPATPILTKRLTVITFCSRLCKNVPECISLRFNKNKFECLLYSTPLDKNLTNYVDSPGIQYMEFVTYCSSSTSILEMTTPPPKSTEINPKSDGPRSLTGWGLLYPVLITVAVIIIIILIIIAVNCINEHCEKKHNYDSM
ncbi:hypothetical protein LOTGIDRAFT_173977 [Lottia gigantea]|uniref:Apple domain-containing protein n=1 Tax=Lottia gigantea TaxID=225164 RepID=V4A558_LOTGI|nr:hypothetical protein LOTGIDRAFT_173977 [Lottia gigantea]ESO99048.1 hypothetical protein LOTGIDRAFT_173977 [Lottia gigantea]